MNAWELKISFICVVLVTYNDIIDIEHIEGPGSGLTE